MSASDDPSRFDLERVAAWSVEIAAQDLSAASVALIVHLEQMSRHALSVDQRIAQLKLLDDLILHLVVEVPRLPHAVSTGMHGLSVEQRIICMTCKNLLQAIDDINEKRGGYADPRWHWCLQQLYRFLLHQVEYSVRWGRSLPGKTWQRVHQLYIDLPPRLVDEHDADSPGARLETGLEPERIYKQILLLGLVEILVAPSARNEELFACCAYWAMEVRLMDRLEGSTIAFRVDFVSDSGPVARPGARRSPGERVCFVQPPPAFLSFAAQLAKTS